MDNKAFGKLDYTLALLSAGGGKRHGCIINSLHQVTAARPPKFTVSVNRDNETCKAIQEARSFSVTLLAEDAPSELIDRFGYKSGRVLDKFEGWDVKTDGFGNPYITDHMAAHIACRVTDMVEIGNYVLFIGEAAEGEVLSQGGVLTLSAFTNRGKPTPAAATVYRAMEGNGFRCTVCGYVHESETLPADYICPVCRAPASKFVKQD